MQFNNMFVNNDNLCHDSPANFTLQFDWFVGLTNSDKRRSIGKHIIDISRSVCGFQICLHVKLIYLYNDCLIIINLILFFLLSTGTTHV